MSCIKRTPEEIAAMGYTFQGYENDQFQCFAPCMQCEEMKEVCCDDGFIFVSENHENEPAPRATLHKSPLCEDCCLKQQDFYTISSRITKRR